MRAANTYRGARRNACFNSHGIWSEKHYHPEHHRKMAVHREKMAKLKEAKAKMASVAEASRNVLSTATNKFVQTVRRVASVRPRHQGRGQ